MTTKISNPSQQLPLCDHDQSKPWVTVICTSYNHAAYVEQALKSVIKQTYPNVELIVIDNASTDGTSDRIEAFVEQHPAVQSVRNSTNIGLCRAFNQGLKRAQGEYIIDLSADDLLLPQRIARQIGVFAKLPETCGVVFSNAAHVCPAGKVLSYHYPINANGRSLKAVPTGDVFREVLASYFICTPTMMMRRSVLDALNGYDESLSYEDFDFWVRSARHYQYAYVDEVLTYKRRLPNSLYSQITRTDTQLLVSTFRVCSKAYNYCRTPEERKALAGRIRTFIRKAFYVQQFELAGQFGELLRQIEKPGTITTGVLLLSHLRLPVNHLYRHYLRVVKRNG